jgi:hypothetical protein
MADDMRDDRTEPSRRRTRRARRARRPGAPAATGAVPAPLLASQERAALAELVPARERVEAVLRGWRGGVTYTWALTARRLVVLERRGWHIAASLLGPAAVAGVDVTPADGGVDVRLRATPADHALPATDPARAGRFIGALRRWLGAGPGTEEGGAPPLPYAVGRG